MRGWDLLQISDFLSDLGSVSGLWLGLSVVSVAELLGFIIEAMIFLFRSQ